MPPCEGGICNVHETFEAALLKAVESGSDTVTKVVRAQFEALQSQYEALQQRLDESYADRIRLHQRLDRQSEAVATLKANVDSLMVRRAHDRPRPAPAPAPDGDRVPSMPRWAAMIWYGTVAVAGAGFLLIILLVRDPRIREALIKALGGVVLP